MRKNNFEKNFIPFLLVLIPILAPYNSGISFILLPEIILLSVIGYKLLKYKFRIVRPKSYEIRIIITFLCFGLFSSLAIFYQDLFSFTEFAKAFLRMTFYYCSIIILCGDNLNFKRLIVIYKFVAIIVSLYLIIQKIAFQLFNIILPWLIPGLRVHSETYYHTDFDMLFQNFYRPSSIFVEPAHFSEFVIPIFIYVLFSKNSKYKYIISIIFTIALIFSTSGTGIVFTFILWGIWFFKTFILNFNKLSIVVLPLMASIIFFIVAQNFEIIVSSLNRLNLNNPLSSINIRLIRGYIVYSDLPLLEKIFGIGYGNYGTYVTGNNINTIYDLTGNKVWVNTGAYLLTGTGIIGFFAFLSLYLYLFIKSKSFYKLISLFLILSIFFSDFTSRISVILPMIILINGIHKNERSYNA